MQRYNALTLSRLTLPSLVPRAAWRHKPDPSASASLVSASRVTGTVARMRTRTGWADTDATATAPLTTIASRSQVQWALLYSLPAYCAEVPFDKAKLGSRRTNADDDETACTLSLFGALLRVNNQHTTQLKRSRPQSYIVKDWDSKDQTMS